MVEFKKYEGSTTEMTDLGTVKDLIGKGGNLTLRQKNFNDNSKRVVIFAEKKDGTSAVISCSKQVSDALRAKKLTISQLAGLSVLENTDGVAFVSMPASEGLKYAVDKIKVEATVVTAEALQDLIAF